MSTSAAIVSVLSAFMLGLFCGFTAWQTQGTRWREWSCGRDGATLVADSLCVRSDSSYRVPEPAKR